MWLFGKLAQSLSGRRGSIASKSGDLTAPIEEVVARPPVEGDVDLEVRQAFFPDPHYKGTVIEVGAARPDYLSVSASFRRAGWRAIAIEPNPYFCNLHRREGADVIECACGAVDQDEVPFFVVESQGEYLGGKVTNESFSSLGIRGKYHDLLATVQTTTKEIRVKVRRLDTILDERKISPADIDILSIDVEGWELEVLAGLSPHRQGPKVLIVENLFDDPAYFNEIGSRGYNLWKNIKPNDVFIRSDIALCGG